MSKKEQGTPIKIQDMVSELAGAIGRNDEDNAKFWAAAIGTRFLENHEKQTIAMESVASSMAEQTAIMKKVHGLR